MRWTIFTLFPEFFAGPLQTSLIGKAIAAGVLCVDLVNFRDYATDRHRTVDDAPYGGGPGMVLKPEPIAAAFAAHPLQGQRALRVYLTPWGEPLRQARVRELANYDHVQVLCGRYEGVDERVLASHIDLYLSLGDFVLAGGEAAALCLLEAVARYVPGVLGAAESLNEESFAAGNAGLLEGPQYTRPPVFAGQAVPDVLLSGDHAKIAAWRRAQALARTRRFRPELLPSDSDQEGGGS